MGVGDTMKKKSKIILVTILVLIVFSILGYETYKYINNHNNNNNVIKVVEKYKEIQKENDPDVVEKYREIFKNDEIIGEFSIDNLDLKVPVAHTTNNDYYLNHLIDKSYNEIGSTFMDYRNKVDDRKIILYGHNSEVIDTDFKKLNKYIDKSFYKDHKYMNFITLDNEYKYEIFSVYIAVNNFRHVNLKENYYEHINWLKNKSMYNTGVEVTENDDILLIQTCYFDPKDSFLIVVGKKIK